MDFKNLKEKIKTAGNTVSEKFNKAKDNLSENFFLPNIEELNAFINKEKIPTNKKSAVIFLRNNENIAKNILYIMPILKTKASIPNIKIKCLNLDKVEIFADDYGIKNTPCLVVYKEGEVEKLIEGGENIMKIVKDLELDFAKLI